MENKPKFEPGKEPGTPFKVKLEATEPFKSGTSQYGEWHGYNVTVESKEMTWFASSTVKRIVDSSGVEAREEFILELRNFKDKEGNVKKAWYINGKTAWEYEDNGPGIPIPKQSIEMKDVKPSPVSEPASLGDASWTLEGLNKKIEALEERMDKCESSEDKIPF